MLYLRTDTSAVMCVQQRTQKCSVDLDWYWVLEDILLGRISQWTKDLWHVQHESDKVIDHSEVSMHFLNKCWFSHFCNSLNFLRVSLQIMFCDPMPYEGHFAHAQLQLLCVQRQCLCNVSSMLISCVQVLRELFRELWHHLQCKLCLAVHRVLPGVGMKYCY